MPQEPLHLVQIHSGLNHSSRTGMAEIMEMEIRHLGLLQREIQTSADIARIQPCLCFARKHQLRIHRTASSLVLQQVERGLIEREGASLAIFRLEYRHSSPKQIHASPGQAQDLPLSHAGMDGK